MKRGRVITFGVYVYHINTVGSLDSSFCTSNISFKNIDSNIHKALLKTRSSRKNTSYTLSHLENDRDVSAYSGGRRLSGVFSHMFKKEYRD